MRLTEGMEIDGRYRLRYRLGSGGMADVWCADDSHLNRQVALKVLHERFAQDRDFVERFRREASAAAGLQHPNVVAVFDRGEVDGTYYIAMEYVEGPSLKDLISRGLSIDQALEITRQLLDAAQFAHHRGVIHRDIKPQNVLVDNEGRVRVTDFGIAKAEIAGSEITQAGEVVGTATYFSPEQAQGEDVGAAGDIYSIGIVLYEMLTGHPPFEGETSVAVAMKHISEQPKPPSSVNPLVSRALDSIVLRALAKLPGNRYASATEFAAALRQAQLRPDESIEQTLTHTALPPLPSAPARNWRWLAIGLGVVALALVAWLATRGEQVIVPSVIGDAQEVATERLIEEGFEVTAVQARSQIEQGEVIEQDPPAGTEAEEESLVTITISLGPGNERIPDLRGETEDAAVRELKQLGFEPRLGTDFSSSVGSGKVVRTTPPAGTTIAVGSEVMVVISEGSEAIPVPSVVGLDVEIARADLRSAGFIPNEETRDADEPEGQVVEQVPAAGEQLDRGEQVTIVVSTGAGSIVLPDVVGQTRKGAREALQDLGVRVLVEPTTTESPSEEGRVLDQAPAAGTRVHSRDRVTIFVGKLIEPEPPPAEEE